jgi:hypothetical protein
MKLVLAIICSLLLAGTPFVLAQAPVASVGHVAHTVCPCGMGCHCDMPCCCGRPASPKPQQVPTVPAPPSNQTQLLTLAPAALAWMLPAAPVSEIPAAFSSPLTANRIPLFTRNCAFLI